MSAKIYWNLLVFFCVLCQGIIGTLSQNYTDESSELLVRQKRVINRLPGGDKRELILSFPYVVSVKQNRGPISCVGIILTQHIILTISKCVELEITRYRVHSGSGIIGTGSHPTPHNITEKYVLTGTHPFRPTDGIALLTISPSIEYSASTQNIQIYDGYIDSGALGTVAGWGIHGEGDPGTAYPTQLRSITVPIIKYLDCALLYMNFLSITERDICTFDTTGHQYCGFGDVGAPLVIKVRGRDQLVGAHIWNGRTPGWGLKPDVFVDLRNPRYKNWIEVTVRNIEEHLNRENLRYAHHLHH